MSNVASVCLCRLKLNKKYGFCHGVSTVNRAKNSPFMIDAALPTLIFLPIINSLLPNLSRFNAYSSLVYFNAIHYNTQDH